MIEFRAQVARRLLRRDWKILRAINARKMRPKIIEAATITPMTTLGSPDLEDELLAWLASTLPVLVLVVLTVLNEVRVTLGGGVVTTCALVRGVVDVVLGVVLVRGVVDGADGVITVGRVAVVGVAVVRVFVLVELVVVPGPKISESRDSRGSTSSSLPPRCRRKSWCSCTSRRSSSRATRASSLLGGKCIARIACYIWFEKKKEWKCGLFLAE
jgi:hypothetical protein